MPRGSPLCHHPSHHACPCTSPALAAPPFYRPVSPGGTRRFLPPASLCSFRSIRLVRTRCLHPRPPPHPPSRGAQDGSLSHPLCFAPSPQPQSWDGGIRGDKCGLGQCRGMAGDLSAWLSPSRSPAGARAGGTPSPLGRDPRCQVPWGCPHCTPPCCGGSAGGCIPRSQPTAWSCRAGVRQGGQPAAVVAELLPGGLQEPNGLHDRAVRPLHRPPREGQRPADAG